MPWHVTAFYRFQPFDEASLPAMKEQLREVMEGSGVLGLVILAPEGFNGTVAGPTAGIEAFKSFVQGWVEDGSVRFKDSFSEEAPFHRVSIDLRKEIVGLKRTDLVPKTEENRHLTPAEWHAMLLSDEPKIIIDTRNDYETKIGKFRGAIDPGIKKFSDWKAYLQSADLPKDVPVMIYCTGGIRCEKAILEMDEEGFQRVVQLRDGILGYLAEYPDGEYEGECYVFDDRTAVDAHLRPSALYSTCPGCGLAGDRPYTCEWCGDEFKVCAECEPKWKRHCSKTCRDRVLRRDRRQD
jgi:UPF0176 protein